MIPHDLKAGLAEIAGRRSRRRGQPPGPRSNRRLPPVETCSGDGPRLQDLPGAELIDVRGRPVFVLTRNLGDLLPGQDLARDLAAALHATVGLDPGRIDPGLEAAAGRSLEDLIVMDLETTGFWGCPIFLVGLVHAAGDVLVTRQILARDYPEEPGMLFAAAEILARGRVLVTFNGKSYDVPCFRERAVMHGVDHSIEKLAHVDILHPARRRFGPDLPDCRLQTLERRVAGIHRHNDLPSAEVPAAYHAFAGSGHADRIAPILHHSRVDLLSTVKILERLLVSMASTGRSLGHQKRL